MSIADVRNRIGRRLLMSVAVSLALMLAASPVLAAKWTRGCPKIPKRMKKVGNGSGFGDPHSSSPHFEHVGHQVTYELMADDVARYGGFSTEPDGNTVEITILPKGGEPIPLPPFPVTAVSPSVLTFTIPDSRETLGRLVVGPARIVVRKGATELFEVRRQVIIPPMNDIQALSVAGGEVEVLGAMGLANRLWIPLDFSGFGTGPNLSACPAEMTPMVAFAVDFAVKKGDGQAIPGASIINLSKNRLFLGDFAFSDLNLYGLKLPGRLLMKRLRGQGFTLCALNDTFQLVLMIPLGKRASNSRSEIVPLVRDGSPLVVRLRNISADAAVAPILSTVEHDDLGLECQ